MVVDFGVARVAMGSGVTATGDYVGTPRYMAPEQIRNARSVDAKADVFALGCILFECLTGARAFAETDPVTVIARILFEATPAPSALRPELPPSLDRLVASMLERDPARRCTMDEAKAFAADLRADLERTAIALPARRRSASDDREALPIEARPPWATADDAAPPSFAVGTNAVLEAARRALPVMHGAFVGRGDERGRLRAILRAGSPVIAVWGGPGVGKTRLVVEVVREAIDAHDPPWDALVYAELGEARDTDEVLRAFATAAHVSVESSTTPELALAGALGKLGRVLLIADPVEHIAPLIATLSRAFQRAAPRLQLIALSRRKGCPSDGVALEVGALPTAATDGSLSSAARLILERMAPGSPGPVPAAAAERAERLASALEGNPLAIELAVPSAQILGVDGLLARLAIHADGALGGIEPVRVGMHAALESSYGLLTERERAAFAQCAVFRGPFAFEAAEAVIDGCDVPVFDLVRSLREHSLLTERPVGLDGEVRLAMPAAVRDLAWQKLRSVFDPDPALCRHAAYYARLHERRASGVSSAELARLERDADNLFAVAEFCLAGDPPGEREGHDAADGIRALVALEPAILPRGAVSGYLRLLDEAIAWTDARGGAVFASLGASVRSIRARFDGPAGRAARAKADLARCLDDARAHGDGYREGLVLLDLGVIHHLEHDWGEARKQYEAAVERLESVDAPWAFGRCLGNVGALCHDDGDLQAAARMYGQAIDLLKQAGEDRRRANFTGNLALVAQELGDPERSRALFERSLALLESIRDARLLAIVLGNLGVLELECGDANRAVALHERALALLAGSGDVRSRVLCLARLAAALAALDRTARARGRLAQAERLAAEAGELVVEVVELTRAFLHLADSRAAAAEGRGGDALASLASAKLRAERAEHARHGDRSLRERSDDVRAALRILGRMLAEHARESS